MNPLALTAQDVLDRYPNATKAPYRLRLHGDALACMAGKRAWVLATPNGNGTWEVVGRLGRIGNIHRDVLVEGPLPIEPTGDAIAGTGEDPDAASRITSAVFWAAMRTRTIADNLPLLVRYPDLDLHGAGGVFPFQADGTLHGMPFYFRYRHNHAVLKVGHGDLHFKPTYMSDMEYGQHEDQGWLDDEDFIAVMSRLTDTLERAPILWEFPGVTTHDVGPTPAGSPDRYAAWGKTPQEAWERLHEPSVWLREMGWDDAKQAENVAAQQMRDETLTVDDRAFPDPEPRFAASEQQIAAAARCRRRRG